ncbi:MAG: hypothetical protein KGD64_05850 [Candidatus Heimdallarchaeota archaeon]|nr:hypothetical protein [Candidatus Heimdallarchaeota archaeon]
MSRNSYFIPGIILGQLLLVFLILYFNVGMFGFDAYIHLQYVDSILGNHHIIELDIAKSYYDFVGFHLFASAISSLTGLEPKIIYEFVSVSIPILLFDFSIIAFIRHLEKKRKGYTFNSFNIKYLALVLLFPSIIGIQMFLGRPNSLGIGLFSLCLYLYICKPESFRSQIIAGFLAIVTVKVHHLSAVFLLPVILYSSIFLARNYKAILSLVYAIPAVIIVETILDSREFSIVNLYFSRNETYETLYNIFIKNEFSLLVLWLIVTLIGFLIRMRYSKKIMTFFSKQKITSYLFILLVFSIITVEIVGLFNYTTGLSSWYISAELVIIFLLSGIALIFPNNAKTALFALGFCFYGFTVLFSLVFSSAEHELSWVAPRTFIFTIIFVSILAFLAISDVIGKVKRRFVPIFFVILIANSYLSMAYMAEQYLPGYNLTSSYENMTFAYSFNNVANISPSTTSMSFSVSKYIEGVDIYRLPLLLDSNSSLETNADRLLHSWKKYIVIGFVMDQWLGTPLYLSQDDISYYLGTLRYYNYGPLTIPRPTFNLIMSNGHNYLLYNVLV